MNDDSTKEGKESSELFVSTGTKIKLPPVYRRQFKTRAQNWNPICLGINILPSKSVKL